MPHQLTEEQKRSRVDWCLHMLRKFHGGRSERVWDIVTDNETVVYRYDPETELFLERVISDMPKSTWPGALVTWLERLTKCGLGGWGEGGGGTMKKKNWTRQEMRACTQLSASRDLRGAIRTRLSHAGARRNQMLSVNKNNPFPVSEQSAAIRACALLRSNDAVTPVSG